MVVSWSFVTLVELPDSGLVPAVALVALLAAAVTGMAPFVYVGSLAWLGHIVVGWGTGDRVRSAATRLADEARAMPASLVALAPEAAGSFQP